MIIPVNVPDSTSVVSIKAEYTEIIGTELMQLMRVIILEGADLDEYRKDGADETVL